VTDKHQISKISQTMKDKPVKSSLSGGGVQTHLAILESKKLIVPTALEE